MEIVINRCFGGFSVNRKCAEVMAELGSEIALRELEKDKPGLDFNSYEFEDRTDKYLIQAVKKLGKDANATHAYLKIITIPDGIKWEIEDYNGMESVAEKHRKWN